jgi:predicted nucleic acid-binding protein
LADDRVVNASPLIVLAKAGSLSLLDEPGARVLVPEAVAREVLTGPRDDPARRQLEAGWGERVAAKQVPAEIVEWGLGAGESEVLAVAQQRPGAVAVLDDAEARACARALGLRITGTLGLIARAQRMKRIPDARRVIDAVIRAGLHVDPALLDEVMRRLADDP